MNVIFIYIDIYLILYNIIQYQMSRKSARELRKPLKITFVGEDAVDEGGVRKEFF